MVRKRQIGHVFKKKKKKKKKMRKLYLRVFVCFVFL